MILAPSVWRSDAGVYDRLAAPATVRLSGGAPIWLFGAVERLARFSGYGANWNGFGERQISGRAVLKAALILREISEAIPAAAPSAVVPLATGGIQIEWGDDSDVIVEVTAEGEAEGYLGSNNHSWDLREAVDFAQLFRFLAERV